jgi:hypothetical protein
MVGESGDLMDPAGLDFRPAAGSRLLGAGCVVPGITGPHAGSAPDVGAYSHQGERWEPGCPHDVTAAGAAAAAAMVTALGKES